MKYKNYIVYYRQITPKKKNPIKQQFTSKSCSTIFNGIKIAIKKCEQKYPKYPYAYQHTHSGIRKKQK